MMWMDESGITLVFIAFFFAFVLDSFYGITVQESVASLLALPLSVLGFAAANMTSLLGIIVLVTALYACIWLSASIGLENLLGFAAVLALLALIL